jgi:hypothetical protein
MISVCWMGRATGQREAGWEVPGDVAPVRLVWYEHNYRRFT